MHAENVVEGFTVVCIVRVHGNSLWKVYGKVYRSWTQQLWLPGSRMPVWVVHRGTVTEEFTVTCIGRARSNSYWRVHGYLYMSCTEQQLLKSLRLWTQQLWLPGSRMPVWVVHRGTVIEEFTVTCISRARSNSYWRVHGNLYRSCTEQRLLKSLR